MSIKGKWVSDLGSVMDIVELDDTKMSGTFTTKTGSTQGTYPMVGFANLPEGDVGAIGWVVVWKHPAGNDESITTWSGQVQPDEHGKLGMVTQWLYVKQTEPSENWSSTLVGFNSFRRVPE